MMRKAVTCASRPWMMRTVCFSEFTHVNTESNKPQMVDVSNKAVTSRIAHARCYVDLPPSVISKLQTEANTKELFSKKGPIFMWRDGSQEDIRFDSFLSSYPTGWL